MIVASFSCWILTHFKADPHFDEMESCVVFCFDCCKVVTDGATL